MVSVGIGQRGEGGEHVGKQYFVREDDDVIFYAEVPDCLELILGEYFSYWVVPVFCQVVL